MAATNDTGVTDEKGHGHRTADETKTGMMGKDAIRDAEASGQGLSGYETLSLWQTVKAFKMNSAVCFIVAFSAATDGYQIGMNGNIIANPGFVNQFATQTNDAGEPVLASNILSAWGSIMSVGQVIGMTTLPFLSDRFGRKAAMYWYWLVLAMSVLAESLARTWPVWFAGKLLAGVGVGCMQATIPIYIAEVAPARIRGGLLMSYSFWMTFGGFFAPVALQVLSRKDKNDYLTAIYTQWAQIGIMLIVYIFVPESPFWCATHGKAEQAKKALRMLHWEIKDYDVEQQYQLLAMTVEHEREVAKAQHSEQWWSIFKGTDGKRTIIAMWTLLTQQFVGLTLFSTFASYFFQQAGMEDPFQATCITSAIQIATGISLILVSDKFGRRIFSCGGSTLCWFACVAVGILGVVPRVNATNYLLVFFACLWNMGIVMNGSTGWGYIGEISSQRLRTYTSGFGAAMTCVAGVVMNVLTPYMVNGAQWNWELKTGWFYAGIGLPLTVASWFLIPETKGRTAAELDELFERKIKPWRFHKTQTATQRAIEARDGEGY